MIGVEQIRTLEDRIEKTLVFLAGLKAENAALREEAEASAVARGRAEDRAVAAEARVRELEEAIAVFGRDQARIEEGILHALEKLDAFEDLVLKGPTTGNGEGETRELPPLAHENAAASAPKVAPLVPAAASKPKSAQVNSVAEAESAAAPQTAASVPPKSEPARPAAAELEIF